MSLKSASTVLRSIVSPAVGLSVATLVAAGALSACGETKATPESATPTAKSSSPLPVGTTVNPIESNKQAAPDPAPSASATPATSSSAVASASASPSAAIPLPGDYSRPGQIPNPGKYGPPPGVVPKPGTMAPPKVGTMAPGFAPSGLERRPFGAPSDERPTRARRRVTDADRTALLSRTGPEGGRRSLV